MAENIFRIAEVLGSGEKNALTTNEIARICGLKSRDIRHFVEAERLEGTPICSSGAGYYLAASMGEVIAWNNSMRRRMKNMEKSCAAVMRSACDIFHE